MSESLRTDYDRMVGESYKDYAARCRGRMLAAERDRDAYAAEVRRLRNERDAALNLLEGYDAELTQRLRDQMEFDREEGR